MGGRSAAELGWGERLGLLSRFGFTKATALEHYLSAEIAYDNGNTARAIKEMEAALSADDADPFLILRMAVFRIDAGDTARGVRLIRGVLEDQPRNPDAWLELSRAHHLSGEHQAAIETAERVVNLDPGHVAGSLWFSELLENEGRPDKSIEVLKTALRHHQRDVRLRVALSRTFLKQGEYPAAKNTLKTVHASRQVPAEHWLSLGRAANRRGKPGEGAAHFERAFASTRLSDELRLELVDMYLADGNLIAAERHLFSLAVPDEADADRYLELAKRWVRAGRLFEARRLILAGITQMPTNIRLILALASVELNLARLEAAVILLKRTDIHWSSDQAICRQKLLKSIEQWPRKGPSCGLEETAPKNVSSPVYKDEIP